LAINSSIQKYHDIGCVYPQGHFDGIDQSSISRLRDRGVEIGAQAAYFHHGAPAHFFYLLAFSLAGPQLPRYGRGSPDAAPKGVLIEAPCLIHGVHGASLKQRGVACHGNYLLLVNCQGGGGRGWGGDPSETKPTNRQHAQLTHRARCAALPTNPRRARTEWNVGLNKTIDRVMLGSTAGV
jgi:hypothetical protein